MLLTRSCRYVSDLEREMKKQGSVIWPKEGSEERTSSVNRPVDSTEKRKVCSWKVAELLRRTAIEPNILKCHRLRINNVCFLGPLDLSGAGKVGAPIIPFELENCELEGGIDTSFAHMQGISIKDCYVRLLKDLPDLNKKCTEKANPATVVGKIANQKNKTGNLNNKEKLWLRFTGATIAEEVKVEGLHTQSNTILDFSHTTLQHSCKLINISSCALRNENQSSSESSQAEETSTYPAKGQQWMTKLLAPFSSGCGEIKAQPGKNATNSNLPEEAPISYITFTSAAIAGGLILERVHVNATHQVDKRALDCTETRLSGSLTFKACELQGEVTLTGATIEGQLSIKGGFLKHVNYGIMSSLESKSEKALSANGVTIRGGIIITEIQVFGDVRFRNATVVGAVLFSDVTIESSDQRVAFRASNATFESDMVLRNSTVLGEINLSGATIKGNLRLDSVKLIARRTGSALNATLITVVKEIHVGRRIKNDKQTLIIGLVNFNYVDCASAMFGEVPDETRIIDSLWLSGAILLREAKVRGPVFFSGVFAHPCEEITDSLLSQVVDTLNAGNSAHLSLAKSGAMEKLKELAVYVERVILYGVYANLGTRLFVRLDEESTGHISLYGARTGTIGALHAAKQNGNNEFVTEWWGKKPTPMEGWRSGKPDPEKSTKCITVNLDEFRYSRLFDKREEAKLVTRWQRVQELVDDFAWLHLLVRYFALLHLLVLDVDFEVLNIFANVSTPKPDEPESIRPRQRLKWWLVGRPSPEDVLPRHGWLRHQISNIGMPNELVTWPYRQLAKVYRDMGDLQRAYVYETERRWLEILHGDRGRLQRVIDSIFGVLFGFGYSSGRALSWLVVWLITFSVFIYKCGGDHVQDGSCTCYLVNGHKLFGAVAEAFHQLWPDWLKSQTAPQCEFTKDSSNLLGNDLFYIAFGILQFVGRVLAVGAALTFTGVLQEKAQVATSVRD